MLVEAQAAVLEVPIKEAALEVVVDFSLGA